METVNYTDFRSNLKHWFDKVVNDVSDIIIKRKSGKDLVLISLDEYNSLKETTYLLILSPLSIEQKKGKKLKNLKPKTR
jgi:antitoxin YefM